MLSSSTPGPFQSIQGYVSRVHRRLRLALASRGLGATVVVALLLTLACVYVANQFAFSNSSIVSSRAILFGSLIAVLVWVLIRPILRLNRSRTAAQIEKSVPAFDGRVETLVDQTSGNKGAEPNPLLDLLAEDTWRIAETAPTRYVAGIGRVFAYMGITVAAFAFLFWLGHSGPGYWGYGASRLWAGWLEPGGPPLYQIVVEPGDTTIRQGTDLLVTAETIGFESTTMQLDAKFASSVDWEQASMQRQLEGSGFEFAFAGVREPLRYYVTAGGIRSEEFEVNVVEMPHVENLKLTYHYPAWTGMKPLVEDPGADLRAVAGTEVEVEIQTDKPLTDGILRVNNEESLRLDADGLQATGRLKVGKEGEYFIAAMYQGEIVRLTQDFFISVVPDKKPVVKFLRPGRDAKATSIEEVATEFQAHDDFGLRSFDLHYSVNGEEFQKEPLLERRGRRESKASHTFYLEEMGSDYSEAEDVIDAQLSPVANLEPGDLVSYYAVARDGKTAVQTDMFFIEVRPFELEFFQRQAAGGGMPGGGEQTEISRRQKEILAATWNLIQESKDPDGQSKAEIRENSLLLSEFQLKLRDQAETLARRVKARQLLGTNKDFEAFVENIEKAAEYMGPAGLLLEEQELQESISPEQKSLRHLRRAESIFRRIELAFGRGGGGGQKGRDLADMFELEMDLEKNQYETGTGSPQQLEREIDEALEKLRELAKRQEKLAEQQRASQARTFSQRWQQEMLRREAEELRRRLEELQQRQQASQQQSGQQSQQSGQQQSQGQSGQQSQQQSQGQSGQQSQQQSGQQSGQQQSSRQGSGSSGSPRLESAIRNLQQAAQDMQASQSASGQQNSRLSRQQSQAYARRARDELAEALRKLAGRRRQQTDSAISDIAKRAAQLTQQQKEIAGRLTQALQDALREIQKSGGTVRGKIPSGMSPREELELAERKTKMQEEVEALEREIQQTARRMENGEASRKLREALGDLQQSEVGSRLRKAAMYIRRGYAVHIAQSEAGVTRALEKLQQQVGDAERLAAGEGQGVDQGLERYLAELEELRRQLEEAAGLGRPTGGEPGQGSRRGQDPQGAQGAEARQPGSESGPGQQGQRAGQQPGGGRQQGSQQGARQSGQQEGQGAGQGEGERQGLRPGQGERLSTGGREGPNFTRGQPEGGPMQWSGSANNFGGRRPQGGVRAWDAGTLADVQRALRQAVEELPGLTQQLRREGIDEQELAELRRFVAGLSQSRFPGNPQLLEKEHRKVLALLEQLELQVRRQVEQEKGNFQVRVTGTNPVPEQYREAVAEYFRRLSQGR